MHSKKISSNTTEIKEMQKHPIHGNKRPRFHFQSIRIAGTTVAWASWAAMEQRNEAKGKGTAGRRGAGHAPHPLWPIGFEMEDGRLRWRW